MKHILTLAALFAAQSIMAQGLNYPAAPSDATTDTYFGQQVADPYRPLEDDNAPATLKWVNEENALTQSYISKIPFRKKLLKRLTEVATYSRTLRPWYSKRTGKWYFYRNNGRQNQNVLCQMSAPGQEASAQVLLDPNTLSADGTVALKSVSFSKDGRYMSYGISRSGSDWSEFYVMDLQTGQLTGDHITYAKFTGANWFGNGFFYSGYSRPESGSDFSGKNENHTVYYHKLGTSQSEDEMVFRNPSEPLLFYTTSVNDDETVQLLFEDGGGKGGENVYFRLLGKTGQQFQQLTRGMEYRYDIVMCDARHIIMLTNDEAPRYRLVEVDLAHPERKHWKTLIAEQPTVMSDANVIGGQLYVTHMQDATNRITIHSLDGRQTGEVKLPGVGSASISGSRERQEVFYSFNSITTPSTVYSYDAATGKSTVYSQPAIRFKSADYVTTQVFYTSKDGTRVPMFISHKKGLKLNGKNPTLLYGYGGFNISLPPSFSTMRIPFLEMGGIYVQANLRGGSEYGEEWHKAGTLTQKQNVFDDFIAAAEWLIANKYTSRDYLAINGGSNGGLLVGACMTQRPDLFKVCIPQVGVMDMLRYHRFTIGWNWASDYGTSADSPEMFSYLLGYSPLHNIKKGTHYPATLVTTADHDDRVVPAHSFKFAATLQAAQAAQAPILIRIDSKAGHGAGKPLSKTLEEQADIYSFILYNMGLKF